MPRSIRSTKRTTRSMMGNPACPNTENRQVKSDNLSCAGSSCSSMSRSSAHSRLRLAELKEKQLQERILADTKELEAKREKAVLDAKQEIELAKLEVELEEVEESEEDGDKGCDPERLESYLQTCQSPKHISLNNMNVDIPGEAVHPLLAMMQSLKIGSELPRVELTPFSGNPAEYWKFMRQFEYYIEGKVSDPGQKLLYLLHYCNGAAKDSIQECVMLKPEHGLQRAKKILEDRYGQPHYVARSLLDGLLSTLSSISGGAEALTALASRMESCHITLTEMEYTADMDSLTTIETIVKSFPRTLQYQWADNVDKISSLRREPKFIDLLEFVSNRARIARSRFGQLAEGPTNFARLPHQTKHDSASGRHPRTYGSINVVDTHGPHSCVLCHREHPIKECPRFVTQNSAERWELVKKHRVCFRCLQTGHPLRECAKKDICGVGGCQSPHHELLHEHQREPVASSVNQSVMTCGPRTTLLGIIPVQVVGKNGSVITYALLDSGSDTTLVSNKLARSLGQRETPIKLCLTGVSGSQSVDTKYVAMTLRSLSGDDEICIERAVCLEKLPIRAPVDSDLEFAKKLPHLTDLPIRTVPGVEVGLLIGCDVPEAHWVMDQRLGGKAQPYGVKTRLGWMLLGPLSSAEKRMISVNCVQRSVPSIADLIERLYNNEFGDSELETAYSVEDVRALQIVREGTILANGKYVVPLPWKDKQAKLVDNRVVAKKRIGLLRSRLIKDSDYHERYATNVEKMLERGYAVKVSPSQISPDSSLRYYIPHHGVVNPKKPGKLRVVLDCAAKYHGSSLNDFLLQGPDTTNELTSVLMRFRRFPIAVAADIEEMFMQVKVSQQDRGALRFLWWPDGDLNQDVMEYQMTAHPFGAKSSPFCATYALRKTAEEFGHLFDEDVAAAVSRDFYVDDYLSSMTSVDEARRIVSQIRPLLSKGGFRLCKWVSNVTRALEDVPVSDQSGDQKSIGEASNLSERMLGIEWNPKSDSFVIRLTIKELIPTRRSILSAIASIYDPLGIVSPVILPAKALLQSLCKKGLGWDTPLDHDDLKAWTHFKEGIGSIGPVHFPRCIGHRIEHYEAVELHMFCDASERGYGAVGYARFQTQDSAPYCTLLAAKSHVSPLKAITIPRLELSSAVSAIRLENIICKGLQLSFKSVNYWTDSAVVLHYIRNQDKRFSTFVANRLSLIHSHTSPSQWKHVSGPVNPADLASRGIFTPEQLQVWIQGPNFLREKGDSWPNEVPNELPSGIEWKRTQAKVLFTTQAESVFAPLLTRYSSWIKLLKVIGWVLRFKNRLVNRSRQPSESLGLTTTLRVTEIKEAERVVLKMIQDTNYSEEIATLAGGRFRELKSSNALIKLCPILHHGLLRVGGRLNYTTLDNDIKYPVILPNKHHAVDLIIQHFHKIEGHSGPGHVLSRLRKHYWIIHGGRAVRRVIGNCITCKRAYGRLCQQQMAPLPLARTEPGWYPFEHTGIDYFGPISVKRGRRQDKRFGCVFTCMKSRAVHLEVANGLSTDDFLNVLTRFIGRRGCPSDLYSDNGTNFVGTKRELRAAMLDFNSNVIASTLLNRGIQWHFNPPAASHRGGVWERIIRSVRRILNTICNMQMLTDDSLCTLFVEVERILNNRPLVPETSSDQDSASLTPNDLLFVNRRTLVLDITSLEGTYNKRWRQLNQLCAVFWKRWLTEYLLTLQRRQRWEKPERDLGEGDLVLVSAEHTPPGQWPLGVVTSEKPSQDGLIRTVNIRTSKGLVTRDVRRICRLEYDEVDSGSTLRALESRAASS